MFNIRAHASHLPGSSNIAADAASRAWVSPFAKTWTNFSASWSQITVPASLRRIYQNFSTTFNPNHWPKARTSSIPVYGGNGSSGVKNYNTQWGYHPNQHDTRTNSVYSPSTTGKTGGSMNHPEIQLLPSSPRAVICHGIISASSSTLLGCSPVIVSQPQERDEKKELQPKEHPSQSSFCKKFTAVSTSPTSTAASFGGLPSWAGSFFSGDRNILP
ncbi:hypothetical protein AM588_10002693 [Phytophthora nicotianae]|uniref:Uncharacterized protein n=1 Tax=Phytophthora nicotianae TaxID=4792 RepID=A0A0W8D217_PHYNI|nr:hypothetical protein AM588_10002693 [Phytophthora nicotianae]